MGRNRIVILDRSVAFYLLPRGRSRSRSRHRMIQSTVHSQGCRKRDRQKHDQRYRTLQKYWTSPSIWNSNSLLTPA